MDNQKKVLVVEDDNMLRNIIMSQLTPAYKVLAARDGEEAMQIITSQQPNLIILDLLLPKVGGFAVLERLRALPDKALAETPVIIVTNLADPQNVERAKQYGVVAYYTKADITLSALVVSVNKSVAPKQ